MNELCVCAGGGGTCTRVYFCVCLYIYTCMYVVGLLTREQARMRLYPSKVGGGVYLIFGHRDICK